MTTIATSLVFSQPPTNANSMAKVEYQVINDMIVINASLPDSAPDARDGIRMSTCMFKDTPVMSSTLNVVQLMSRMLDTIMVYEQQRYIATSEFVRSRVVPNIPTVDEIGTQRASLDNACILGSADTPVDDHMLTFTFPEFPDEHVTNDTVTNDTVTNDAVTNDAVTNDAVTSKDNQPATIETAEMAPMTSSVTVPVDNTMSEPAPDDKYVDRSVPVKSDPNLLSNIKIRVANKKITRKDRDLNKRLDPFNAAYLKDTNLNNATFIHQNGALIVEPALYNLMYDNHLLSHYANPQNNFSSCRMIFVNIDADADLKTYRFCRYCREYLRYTQFLNPCKPGAACDKCMSRKCAQSHKRKRR